MRFADSPQMNSHTPVGRGALIPRMSMPDSGSLSDLPSSSKKALNVAVAGATGRVGRLVVDALLKDGQHNVKAFIRDEAKAAEAGLEAKGAKCYHIDFSSASADEVVAACSDVDSLIWCASGFSETTGNSIDMKGMELLPTCFATSRVGEDTLPKIIMLSSASVTRPTWDAAKKERLVGVSDIPVVRLNPGGILDKKCTAEQFLRDSGVPYCIVRPTGIKFEGWPQGRPVLSQGDVAVGRTNAVDLAEVLVGVLGEPNATGKTFEMFTLAGYPASRSLDPALSELRRDTDGPLTEDAVEAAYRLLQQFLPGEEQDATKLEMGRTYEQVDSGEVAPRERGAAPTQREKAIASGVAASEGKAGKRQRLGAWVRRILG